MLDAFIQKWGYLTLFLGALIEGESVVLTISAMAYAGKFYLPKVMLIAFLGTFIADQALFYLGRYFGARLFARFPKLEKSTAKAFKFLAKYDVPFILIFRFIYGIRIISPVVIGSSKISVAKFTLFNLLAAMLWVFVSCYIGYFIGAFGKMIGISSEGLGLIFSLLIVLIVILIGHFLLAKHSKK